MSPIPHPIDTDEHRKRLCIPSRGLRGVSCHMRVSSFYYATDARTQTTSHTLAYSFIFLALYQEEQEKFYQSLKAAMPADRAPVRPIFSSIRLAYSLCLLGIRRIELVRLLPRVRPIPSTVVLQPIHPDLTCSPATQRVQRDASALPASHRYPEVKRRGHGVHSHERGGGEAQPAHPARDVHLNLHVRPAQQP